MSREQVALSDMEADRERPEGMPDVRPLYAIPRVDRIPVMALLDEVFESLGINLADEGRKAADGETAAELDIDVSMQGLARAASAAEQFLVAVAPSKRGATAAMKAWAESAGDMQVIEAMMWYVEEYPPGGPAPSPNS